MKKTTNIIFVSVICFVLALLSYVTLSREKEERSYFENRYYKKAPEATEESVKNGTYFTELESYYIDRAAGREALVRLSTWADINIFHRPVVNDVVICDEVLLPFNKFEIVNEENVAAAAKKIAENLESVSNTVSSYGGQYLYAAVPCQYVYFEDEYPFYLENRSKYTELSIKAITKELSERGVEFLDIGYAYEALGYGKEYSSTVDNHFSAQGAYVAYADIIKKLNTMNQTGEIPLIPEEEFEYEPIENYYMGSRTRKLFNLIKNEESIYSITPKKPVSFKRYNYGVEVEPVLNFLPKDPFSFVSYPYYMGGNVSDFIIDTQREDLPTILFYGDSFTNATECFMYMSFDKMYVLDMRYYSDMTLEAFINETKPDYVVCLRDYEAVLNSSYNGGK